MPAQQQGINIGFPLGGLDYGSALRQQKPYTTPDCRNVRPKGPLDARNRGGSRPGLMLSHIDDLGSEIRMLTSMVLALGDDFLNWSDTFNGLSLEETWAQAGWATDVPSILPGFASIDTTVAEGEVVRDVLDPAIDTAESYTIEMLLVPWNGEWHGNYRLYLRLDDTTPAYATDSVLIELSMTGATGAYTATMTSYLVGGDTVIDTAAATVTPRPGWLSATVVGDTVTVYWQGTAIMTGACDAQGGTRVGFGLECTEAGGLCLVNVFRAQYYTTGTAPALRSMLVASAGGDIYNETSYGRMTVVASSLSVRDDVSLQAVQSGQKLYIADYGDATEGTDGTVTGTAFDDVAGTDWTTIGANKHDFVVVISNGTGATTDGTYEIDTVAAGSITLAAAPGNGTCSFRIERCPKIYDPDAGTLTRWFATPGLGEVPTGCPLLWRFNDRTCLGGAEIASHVWYMAHRGDELDWDYADTSTEAAVAGTSADAGVPGSPITCGAAHSDDYNIIGCRNELWRMRGDPAYGGSLDVLSKTVGVIGAEAWCFGPGGEFIFISMNGLYAVAPGGDSPPVSVSRDTLPQELINLNPDLLSVSLEYDAVDNGVHIFLTPQSSNTRVHWWLDWQTKTYWPLTLASGHEPMATCTSQAIAVEDAGVILGGRDGFMRRFNRHADDDCGTAVTSYIIIGPLPLGEDGQEGLVVSLDCVLADDSGDVTWATQLAQSFEAAISATAQHTGTWSEGLNSTVHNCGRGQALCLKLTGGGEAWAFESAHAVIQQSGSRKLL